MLRKLLTYVIDRFFTREAEYEGANKDYGSFLHGLVIERNTEDVRPKDNWDRMLQEFNTALAKAEETMAKKYYQLFPEALYQTQVIFLR